MKTLLVTHNAGCHLGENHRMCPACIELAEESKPKREMKKAILSSYRVYWGNLPIENFNHTFHTNRNPETKSKALAEVVAYIVKRGAGEPQPISRYSILEYHTKSVKSDKLVLTNRYNYLGQEIAL